MDEQNKTGEKLKQKNKVTKVLLALLAIGIFFAFIFSIGADITLKCRPQGKQEGSVQLFSGISRFSESNSDTVSLGNMSQDGSLYLKTPNGLFTRIRFDFDNQKEIYIEAVTVKKIKITYRELDAEAIMNLIETVNDCKAELTDTGVHITVTGKDAYIVLKNMGHSDGILYYLWFVCLAGVVAGGSGEGGSGDTYKIGFIGPLTGDNANYGIRCSNAESERKNCSS